MAKKIAVAWSGGADSTALLLLLKAEGYDVMAWHIDHGWHANSQKISASLAQQAQVWQIPFYALRLEKPKQNVEAEARVGRYASFERLAEQTKCFHVALGHQANDQAETVCMRLLQGAGVSGCQGIKTYRRHNKLHLWRPLLQVSRQQLEQFLKAQAVDWLDDPSNDDCSLWRNKIRQKLFPVMVEKGYDAQALFLRWQVQAEQVQKKIEQLAQHVDIVRHSLGEDVFCNINWSLWCVQSKPIRVFLLQNMVGLLFADGRVFGRRHILAIEQWKEHGGHGWLNLSGCCLYREGKSLQLCQGNTSLRPSSAKSRGNHE